MKKIIALMLIIGAIFVFASCGNKECEHVDNSPLDGVCDDCGEQLAPLEPGGLPLVPAW
jgi:hypothetical protein